MTHAGHRIIQGNGLTVHFGPFVGLSVPTAVLSPSTKPRVVGWWQGRSSHSWRAPPTPHHCQPKSGHRPLTCSLSHVSQSSAVPSLISKVLGDSYFTTYPCNRGPHVSSQCGNIAFSQTGFFVGMEPLFSAGPKNCLPLSTMKESTRNAPITA